MASSNVIRSSAINTNKISFGPNVIKTKTGKKLVNMFHDGKPLRFQTPVLVTPGGAKEFYDKQDSTKLQSIVVNGSLGTGEDSEVQAFLETLERIDQIILETASKNSQEWFGDSFTVGELKKAKMFKSQIRRDAEGKYPPSLQLKMQYYDKQCQTKCYNWNREPVDYSYITKGSKVVGIIEVASIWFIDNSFGVTYKMLQCKVQKNQKIADYAFIEDDPMEGDAANDQEYNDY